MIPLLHDLSDHRILVFGGGAVGARRARTFGRAARVIVVSPTFPESDYGGAALVRARPDPADVAGWIDHVDPWLAVAATDDRAVNEAVVRAARERGCLHNRVDRSGPAGPGSVTVPAVARDGPVTVTVGTAGRSPALSGYLRRRFEEQLDGAAEMARLTDSLRDALQSAAVPAADRRRAVRSVVESQKVWKALRSGVENTPPEAMRVLASALDWELEAVEDLLRSEQTDVSNQP